MAEIFSANREFRANFADTLKNITSDEAEICPEGEKWSIQQVAEHVVMVSGGIATLCSRLAEKAAADGGESSGGIAVSPELYRTLEFAATRKAEAPERVYPKGGVSLNETIETLASVNSTFEEMETKLGNVDLSTHKFPHPYFGDLTAPEWLVVEGFHALRHTQQIERLLESVRK